MYLSGRAAARAHAEPGGAATAARGPTCPSRSPRAWTASNFADCAALGFTPITTCTDLLRPGGYGRLPAYLEQPRGADARRWACARLGDYVVKAAARARPRSARRSPAGRCATRCSTRWPRAWTCAASSTRRARALYERIVRAAACSTRRWWWRRSPRDPRYRAEQNRAVPRKIGSQLVALRLHQLRQVRARLPQRRELRLRDAARTARTTRRYAVRGRRGGGEPRAASSRSRRSTRSRTSRTSATSAATATPSAPRTAGPTSRSRASSARSTPWRARTDRDGFFCRREDERGRGRGARIRGREYHLEVDRARDRASSPTADRASRCATATGAPLRGQRAAGRARGPPLDFSAYLNMALAVDGVLDPRRANPVNAAWL